MTLTNDVADRLFDNITSMTYSEDRTFLATIRALLYRRLPASQSVHIAYIPLASHRLTADMITESIQANDFGYSYTILLLFPEDKNCGKELLDNVRSHVGEGKRYLDSYTVQDDLRVFYVKKLDGLFYRNDHSMLIFLDGLDIRRLHALQMMIPKYLPTALCQTVRYRRRKPLCSKASTPGLPKSTNG